MRVAVVGAGIVGASVAWHLAQGGAQVAVVDEGKGGGLATPLSWAWINASWNGLSPDYVRLRVASMEDWHKIQGQVPGLRVDWSGALIWDLPPDELRAMASERQAQGYAMRLVDRAGAAAIEPALIHPPDLAAHATGDGCLEPAEATRALLADAARMGAERRFGVAVEALLERAGRVARLRLADGTAIEADAVVLAAGAASGALAAQVGVRAPVEDAPALLLWTDPAPRLLNGLVVGPDLELRQRPDGSLLAAGDVDPGDPEGSAPAAAEALMGRVRHALGAAPSLAGWAVGRRPIPRDGLPILGEAAPGLHLAVTHSGVTLAPAAGRLLAGEILRGERDTIPAAFRPVRFAS